MRHPGGAYLSVGTRRQNPGSLRSGLADPDPMPIDENYVISVLVAAILILVAAQAVVLNPGLL